MKKKIAIFDLDGTLLDTTDDLTDAVNYIHLKYGYEPVTPTQLLTMVGNGLRVLLALSFKEGEKTQDFEKMFQEFLEYYGTHSLIKTHVYDGLNEILLELKKRKIPTAIVTNKNIKAAQDLKDKLFADTIDYIFGEDEKHGVKKKPSPDTVYKAIEAIGGELQDALYIGDSEVDVKTAANANIPCLAVAWGFRTHEEQEAAGAKYFAEEPNDILAYF